MQHSSVINMLRILLADLNAGQLNEARINEILEGAFWIVDALITDLQGRDNSDDFRYSVEKLQEVQEVVSRGLKGESSPLEALCQVGRYFEQRFIWPDE